MNYLNHAKFNALFILFLSTCAAYLHFLNINSFLLLLIGATPYTLIITNDLDSESSIVTKLWGPLNPFKAFTGFGHREVLHHFFWGPFILITPFWMILEHFGIDIPTESLVGAVLALEGHIIADWCYSEVQDVKKSWIGKIVRKVI